MNAKWDPGQIVANSAKFDFSTTAQVFVPIPALDMVLPHPETFILQVGLSVSLLHGVGMVRVRVGQGDQEMEWHFAPADAQDYSVEVRSYGGRVSFDAVSTTKEMRIAGAVVVMFQAPEPSVVDRLAQIAESDEQAQSKA
jgi:hypothetical protein